VGTPGNERVDEIADGLATGKRVELYRGPLTTYPISILDVPDDTAVPARAGTARTAPKAKAYSYLSLVQGKPMRHTTWAECERRVKGQSAAKFKKSTSADDEAAILRAWRVDPKSLDVS
jgi:ribonuclease HI